MLELEKKKAEEQLQVKQIIDIVNASIFWKDREGRYLGCNQYVLDMAGITHKDQIIGKTDAELVWKGEYIKVRETDLGVMENGRFDGEEVFDLGDGVLRTYACVKTQLLDNQNSVIGIVGTAIDITAKKEAERLQREAQKLQHENEIKMQKLIIQEKEKLIFFVSV